MPSTSKIEDEFSNLPISRQRKWQLRNPEKDKKLKERWLKERGGNQRKTIYNRNYYLKKKGII